MAAARSTTTVWLAKQLVSQSASHQTMQPTFPRSALRKIEEQDALEDALAEAFLISTEDP